MDTEPDRIRTQIEATRADLATDVDRLADRTSPSRIAQRNWDRVAGRFQVMREKVMGMPSTGAESVRRAGDSIEGAAHTAVDNVRDAAQSAAETVRETPRMAAAQARGNPLAAGLIAFGAGLLAAAMIPESDVERRAARRLADSTEGLREELREPLAESASRLKEDLGQSVRESADEVAQSAKDAARATAGDAQRATQQVKSEQMSRST